LVYKNPTNIEELECMESIYNKILPIIKFENLHIYLKIKVVGGIFGHK
jgi:NADPH-dependent 7-cyano-7-deazaguanine reductase QueF